MARPVKQLPLDEICTLYEQGWTTPMLAERYSVSEITIWSRLKGLGIKLRGQMVDLPENDIRTLYCDARLSTRQIGKQYGVSQPAVARELRRYGIELRPATNRNDLPRDELYDMYVHQRISMEDCGKHFGVSIMGVKGNLKRYGIPVRSLSESHIGKRCSPKSEFKKGQAAHNRKELPMDEIIRLYVVEQWDSVEISKLFGVSHKAILTRLYEAGAEIRNSRKLMRKYGTDTEIKFHRFLKQAGIVGYERQYRFAKEKNRYYYFLDFAWPHLKIDVEIDGGVHTRRETSAKDVVRDAYMQSNGWAVYRITNEHVRSNGTEMVQELVRRFPEMIGGEH